MSVLTPIITQTVNDCINVWQKNRHPEQTEYI